LHFSDFPLELRKLGKIILKYNKKWQEFFEYESKFVLQQDSIRIEPKPNLQIKHP